MKDGQLDEIDRQILRTLGRDGRISNQKLADTGNLSPTRPRRKISPPVAP